MGNEKGVDIRQRIPFAIENFNRQFSVCYGGGDGGLWIDLPMEERMTNARIQQLHDTGAEILAVACLYFLQMFEDAIFLYSPIMGSKRIPDCPILRHLIISITILGDF